MGALACTSLDALRRATERHEVRVYKGQRADLQACVCVRTCGRASVRACPRHGRAGVQARPHTAVASLGSAAWHGSAWQAARECARRRALGVRTIAGGLAVIAASPSPRRGPRARRRAAPIVGSPRTPSVRAIDFVTASGGVCITSATLTTPACSMLLIL